MLQKRNRLSAEANKITLIQQYTKTLNTKDKNGWKARTQFERERSTKTYDFKTKLEILNLKSSSYFLTARKIRRQNSLLESAKTQGRTSFLERTQNTIY